MCRNRGNNDGREDWMPMIKRQDKTKERKKLMRDLSFVVLLEKQGNMAGEKILVFNVLSREDRERDKYHADERHKKR